MVVGLRLKGDSNLQRWSIEDLRGRVGFSTNTAGADFLLTLDDLKE